MGKSTCTMPGKSIDDRFWEKVDPAADCWVWTGAIQKHGRGGGYGAFWSGERTVGAHRWAWERLVGEIPPGLELDHLCRNRACVNPDHLQPVSHAENVRRGVSGVNTRSKAACPQGHAYEGSNLLVSAGRRVCRRCKVDRERRNRIPQPRAVVTSCPRGHAYEGENLHIDPRGNRRCKACNRERRASPARLAL